MTGGQVIKFMCVFLLCLGAGIETVALAARTCLALHYKINLVSTNVPRMLVENVVTDKI